MNLDKKTLKYLLGTPLAILFVPTALFYLANFIFNQKYAMTLGESVFCIYLFTIIRITLKSSKQSIICYGLIYAVFFSITVSKNIFLGETLFVKDFRNLQALLLVSPTSRILLFVVLILILIVFFIKHTHFEFKRWVAAFFLLFVGHRVFAASQNFIDEHYLYKTPINHSLSIKSSWIAGPLFYFYYHWLVYEDPKFNRDQGALDFSLNSIQSLISKSPPKIMKSSKSPNIYFILVESFWDFKSLTSKYNTPDGFDPHFRQLHSAQKSTSAIVSEALGGTANTEFELLCGLPVFNLQKVFTYELNSELDCLPNVLRKKGYATFALHPGDRRMWNRPNVYPKLGFQNYLSKEDMQVKFNKYYMPDDIFLEYSLKMIESELKKGKPLFFHLLTIGLHTVLETEESEQTHDFDRISHDELRTYLQLLRRTTRGLSQFVEKITRLDPNAILVILGDHAPPLGFNYQIYKEDDQIKIEDGFPIDSSLLELLKTPLVTRNLKGLSQDSVRVPHLAYLIYRNLGFRQPVGISDLHSDPKLGLFTYFRRHNEKSGQFEACGPKVSTPECKKFGELFFSYETLFFDHFWGNQKIQEYRPPKSQQPDNH